MTQKDHKPKARSHSQTVSQQQSRQGLNSYSAQPLQKPSATKLPLATRQSPQLRSLQGELESALVSLDIEQLAHKAPPWLAKVMGQDPDNRVRFERDTEDA